MEQQKTGLAKYLSRLDVWALSLSCIIGWGAFVMPGTTFLPIAGPAGTTIAIIIGALVMGIIGMTANAFKEDKEAAEKAGMQAHIAKPLDIEQMLKTLSMVLNHRK